MRENFEKYLAFEKRYSRHTVTAYMNDLEQFEKFVQRTFEIEPEEARHQMIRSWIVDMMEEGVTERSVNRKLSTLRTYFKFLIREGKLESSPMKRVVPPKQSKRLPEFVENRAMDKLFAEVEFKEGFAGVRDRLILDLFYQTGMRLSELINIKESDVTDTRIKVLGKRNKERLIPVNEELASEIRDYIKCKRLEFSDNSEFLLVTDKGQKLYEKFVYRVVNRYLGETTSMKKKSPHVLRHTFATHMLNNGADLNAIKEILGHANLTATQVYTHNSIEKLKEVHKLAHPRGA